MKFVRVGEVDLIGYQALTNGFLLIEVDGFRLELTFGLQEDVVVLVLRVTVFERAGIKDLAVLVFVYPYDLSRIFELLEPFWSYLVLNSIDFLN